MIKVIRSSNFFSIVLPAACLAFCLFSFAQADEKPFSTIRFSVDGAVNTNRDLLHRYFKSSKAIGGAVSAPFYWGRAGLGYSELDFKPKRESLPDFDMILMFVSWEATRDISIVSLSVGTRIGNTLMKFEENQVYRGLGEVSESELHVGVGAGLDLRFWKRLRLQTAWDRITIFTRQRITLHFISVGLSIDFNSPGWLIEILK